MAGMTGMTEMAWGARVSQLFRNKVRMIAGQLGCDPSDLMSCIAFETGESFSPSIRNKRSGATGLIQFMPKTAKGLGTTTEALAAMTAEDQLDVVARYFAPFRGRLAGVEDLYMAILWPKAVGKPNAEVLFKRGTAAYDQNAGLDANQDGEITKGEAAARVVAKRTKGLSAANRG